MTPKISIIVPCFKVEKYLDQCLDSIVGQTLKDIEIILVDDKSPDRTPELCDGWAGKDPRIKVVHKEKNGGLGLACNSGLEIACGEYIAFCDSDDWVDPEMYATMLDAAEKNNADIVFTGLKRVGNDGKPLGNLSHVKEFRIYSGREEVNALARDIIASRPEVREDRSIQMSAKIVLYRKSLLDEFGITFISERVIQSEDLHFNLNVLSHAQRACVLPRHFYNYRCNPASITGKVDEDKFQKIKKLYSFVKEEAEELGIGGDVNVRIDRMLIGYSRSCICQLLRSGLSWNRKRQLVKSICKDEVWTDIWKEYPIGVMPAPHRIFSFGMKHRLTVLLYILAKAR